MNITLTEEQLEEEIKMAYIHGFSNGMQLERGLERDETDEYVKSRMHKIKTKQK